MMMLKLALLIITISVRVHAFRNEFRSYMELMSPELRSESKHILTENEMKAINSVIHAIQKRILTEDIDISKINERDRKMDSFKSGLKAEEVSATCRIHWSQFLEGVSNNEFWALKMFDASAKFSHGIFEGNIKWYGSYDECKAIDVPAPAVNVTENSTLPVPFHGQYCRQYAGFTFVNYTFTPQIGTCVPSTCSGPEILILINEILAPLRPTLPAPLNTFGVGFVACEEEPKFDSAAVAAIIILSIFGVLILISTVYDVIFIQWPKSREKKMSDAVEAETALHGGMNEKTPLVIKENNKLPRKGGSDGESIADKLALAFSVYSNGKKILSTQQSSGTLTALNGVRFLSITWVVLGHAYAFVLEYVHNGVATTEFYKRWTFQAIVNALVSVDSFFALSGLLLSYLTLKEMKRKKGRINWFMFYFHRFWRLTPAYMLVLMISATLSRYFADGPYWPPGGTELDQCKDTWWKNLLYINNFFDDMCFGHAWYLANDMQFFILSPLMLIPLYFHNIIGLSICGLFLLGSVIAPGVVSNQLDLPPSTFGGGGTDSGRERYFKDYYIRPWCRIGPYIVGIIFGFLLYKTNCKVKINKFLNLLLWAVFTAVALAVLYGLHDAINGTELDQPISDFYNAMHRTVWGACVSWVIFACATGNGGFINTLLSWKAFTPLARFSYCVYLVHPMIMYTYYWSRRDPVYLGDLNMIYLFLGHLVISNMAAFVTSLAFEAPMMGLEKVVFKRE